MSMVYNKVYLNNKILAKFFLRNKSVIIKILETKDLIKQYHVTSFPDGSIEFTPGVTMNFTYRFADDPLGETLLGNITWRVDLNEPAHWTHAERTCKYLY